MPRVATEIAASLLFVCFPRVDRSKTCKWKKLLRLRPLRGFSDVCRSSQAIGKRSVLQAPSARGMAAYGGAHVARLFSMRLNAAGRGCAGVQKTVLVLL